MSPETARSSRGREGCSMQWVLPDKDIILLATRDRLRLPYKYRLHRLVSIWTLVRYTCWCRVFL